MPAFFCPYDAAPGRFILARFRQHLVPIPFENVKRSKINGFRHLRICGNARMRTVSVHKRRFQVPWITTGLLALFT